jgi:tetratricopeptide (TPR) repeat protein
MQSLEMLGRYGEAIDLAGRCRSMLRPDDGPRERARLDIQEANVRHLLHDRDRALALYRRAKSVFGRGRARDGVMVARIDVSVANILTCTGRLKEAEAVYRRSRAALLRAGRDLRVAIVDSNLGLNLTFQGRYLDAIRVQLRAREAFERLGAVDRVAMVDLNLSDLYLELNLFEEADLCSRRAYDAFRASGREYFEALAGLNRYFVERNLTAGRGGDGSAAEAYLVRAREVFRANGGDVWAAITDMHHASVLLSAGRTGQARRRAESAWRRLRERGVHSYAGHAGLLLARTLEAEGEFAEAEGLCAEALAVAEAGGFDDLKARALHGSGRIYEGQGRTGDAVEAYTAAIDLIEEVRAGLRLDDFRTSFIEDKMGVYEDMVRILLDRGAWREALDYVERSRSNALLDLISEHIGLGMAPGVAPGTRDPAASRLADLRAELNRLYLHSRELEVEGGREAAPDREETRRRIRRLEAEYRDRVRALAVAEAGGERLNEALGLDRPAPGDVVRTLEPGTVVLEYTALGDEIVLFLLDREGGTVLRELASLEAIERSLAEWNEEIADIACLDPAFVREKGEALAGPALALLREWHGRLLGPAIGRLERARRVIVAPHGPLHHLPFHAFLDGDTHAVARWDMLYVPGLHLYDICRGRARGRGGAPLLVGVREEDLPFVEEEIRGIAALHPDATVLWDEEATAEAFRSAAGTASLIHMTCHGRFRRDNPLFSSLRLGDGELTAHDIYDLDLACDLVVLGACETGVSDIRPGDELMGLCRSFLLAGAPTLVVSLWRVNDRSTMRLMERFHASICAGQTADRALRQAQRRLLAEQPHPYFWAPFIVVGRG